MQISAQERRRPPVQQVYICIDLKSFFASVECVERGLDPMTAKLVVADPTRTEKTICLAVSPALRALGVRNRCRVFEIPPRLDYIMAQPRMALYIRYSARIYSIYLRYFSPEDIHVYSIDEVFIDVSRYLAVQRKTPCELVKTLLRDIKAETGLVATCGIGSNLYLAKIALDIISKHAPDFIGELDETSYREKLWDHRPITDFWRVSRGTSARLASLGILTMRDVANAREDVLYKTFGVDAELLIDHAYGRESVTIADIKAYKPLACELFSRGETTDSINIILGYSQSSGRKSVHGSLRLDAATCSVNDLVRGAQSVYERIMNPAAPIRKLTVCYANLHQEQGQQYDIFSSHEEQERERSLQSAMLSIKRKYGSGSLLRCMDLQEGATARERSRQIGGHRA